MVIARHSSSSKSVPHLLLLLMLLLLACCTSLVFTQENVLVLAKSTRQHRWKRSNDLYSIQFEPKSSSQNLDFFASLTSDHRNYNERSEQQYDDYRADEEDKDNSYDYYLRDTYNKNDDDDQRFIRHHNNHPLIKQEPATDQQQWEAAISDESELQQVEETSNNETYYFRRDMLPQDCGRVPLNIKPGKRRIAGGYDAREGEFPPYVKVLVTAGIFHESMCGGTLISDRHVLTAAHCFLNSGSNRKVRVFHTIFDTPRVRDPVSVSEKVCISPNFRMIRNGHAIWDVAIIKLQRPFQLDNLIQPACLPPRPIGYDQQAHVVGLGLMSDNPMIYAQKLQMLPIKATSCSFRGPSVTIKCFKTNYANHMGDSCQGDSGGPIFAIMDNKLTVIGGVSFGPPICRAGVQGFTAAADFWDMRNHIIDLINKCT